MNSLTVHLQCMGKVKKKNFCKVRETWILSQFTYGQNKEKIGQISWHFQKYFCLIVSVSFTSGEIILSVFFFAMYPGSAPAFYIYLLLVWLFMFIFIFYAACLPHRPLQAIYQIDWIILSFRKPSLSFYVHLLLIWLFMFIFIFLTSSIKNKNKHKKSDK
jgi:uncharacterized membrane protein YhaH (DUF805 family)